MMHDHNLPDKIRVLNLEILLLRMPICHALHSVLWYARHMNLFTRLRKILALPYQAKSPILLLPYYGSVPLVVAKDSFDHIPTFPSGIISGMAGRFADAYRGKIEVPSHFFFLSYLACLGAVLSGRITLDSELATQPRLYLLLLGESADDRKSTAISKTSEFFQSALFNYFHIVFGVGSAEGLLKRINENQRTLLLLDEFRQFISKCSIETSVLLPCVTTLFESNRYENATSRDHIIILNGHLSILAASTTETFHRAYEASFTDIGFTNRLFLVPGKSSIRVPIPPKIPDHVQQALFSELRHAFGYLLEKAPLTIPINAEACRLYKDWYNGMPRSVHTKRLDGYALRFMILFTINDGKLQIDESVVQKVIELMNWQLEVRKQLDPIDADNKIAQMEEKIRRALQKNEMSERDLRNRVNAKRAGLWVFKAALLNLQDACEIALQEVNHHNKKTYRFRLLDQ